MVKITNNISSKTFDLNLLRGWQRSQLELLANFASVNVVSQTFLSGASGLQQGSHALGGKITALTRSNLIIKAGKDNNGQWMWQLNEEVVSRDELQNFLANIDIHPRMREEFLELESQSKTKSE